jgi:hypothetical protein
MSESEVPVGNEKTHKLEQNSRNPFPIYSVTDKNLTSLQASVVYAIIRKSPKQKWSEIAKRMRISERHLYNLRMNLDVVNTVNLISYDLFYCDVSDVLKALSEKAKAGDVGAIKLFLEQADTVKQLRDKIGTNIKKSVEAMKYIMRRMSPEEWHIFSNEFSAIAQAWQDGEDIKTS